MTHGISQTGQLPTCNGSFVSVIRPYTELWVRDQDQSPGPGTKEDCLMQKVQSAIPVWHSYCWTGWSDSVFCKGCRTERNWNSSSQFPSMVSWCLKDWCLHHVHQWASFPTAASCCWWLLQDSLADLQLVALALPSTSTNVGTEPETLLTLHHRICSYGRPYWASPTS